MTETTDTAPDTGAAAGGARKGGLNAMLLPELKRVAGGLGIKATGMRKGALIEAIRSAQAGGQPSAGKSGPPSGQVESSERQSAENKSAENKSGETKNAERKPRQGKGADRSGSETSVSTTPVRDGDDRDQREQKASPAAAGDSGSAERAPRERTRTGDRSGDRATQRGTERSDASEQQGGAGDGSASARSDGSSRGEGRDNRREQGDDSQRDVQRDRQDGNRRNDERSEGGDRERNREANRNRNDDDRSQSGNRNDDRNQPGNRDGNRDDNRDGNRNDNRDGNRNDNRDGNRDSNRDSNRNAAPEEEGSRRNRRRRGRDRDRGPAQATGGNQSAPTSRGNRNEPDMQVLEDDVLAPCAGILDLMDNYAFVRTSGYLPGSDDVYVSMSMVRKFGLRRGDAITGQVRQTREGERKEKYNPLVKLDSVNGSDPDEARTRVEFNKLTPLYPSERLRLETTSTNLIGRVIDIAAPIGKGQRGLIVSPSKAGKTMIMQSIANSITTNNPECHLMVVLVDERPEEVTDFERSVKGEVVSSTFDRPAGDHTIVAELAIERAKRLVELGHDVVVLLDGITRLGRAYNLAAPASGRILSGGVDSAALYPPKRFFGAARNIEDGGSLTILATALIESGSKMDEVIFEEFKGTGNMEIRLRRDFADKRIFPAIDAVQSGTRREELLMSKEELAIVWKLRRVLSGLDGQQALELLLERLKKSQNNLEFLMQVQKTTPTAGAQDN